MEIVTVQNTVQPIKVSQPQTKLKKRRVYVDPEEMSRYIEQISLSMGPRYTLRSDIWPLASGLWHMA